MSSASPAADLAAYGPGSLPAAAPSLASARDYCRRLARTHYENFAVATWLLPRSIRPHFHAVYAYCRWADDLADEAATTSEATAGLDWWRRQLDDCYAGHAQHPVFVALAETIRQFEIPQEPFADLLVAFRRDQQQVRYETVAELHEYCRYSANPVGRIVLCLARALEPVNAELSDSICTGLQWANHCQDVARDWHKGRVYIPRKTLQAHGCDVERLAEQGATPQFRAALAEEVTRADDMLRRGLPLVERVPRWLAGDIWLFVAGGRKILERIRRQDYDVWSRRPVVTRGDQFRLLAGWLCGRGFARRGPHP